MNTLFFVLCGALLSSMQIFFLHTASHERVILCKKSAQEHDESFASYLMLSDAMTQWAQVKHAQISDREEPCSYEAIVAYQYVENFLARHELQEDYACSLKNLLALLKLNAISPENPVFQELNKRLQTKDL